MVFGDYPLPKDLEQRYDQFLKDKNFKEKESIEKELVGFLSDKSYITSIHKNIKTSNIDARLKEIMIGCLQLSPQDRLYKSPLELTRALETVYHAL